MPKAAADRWFNGGEAVDDHCRLYFATAVEQARKTPIADLVKLAQDGGQNDALGLVLLLDQMPRNIYRGSQAAIAYNECDPRALAVVKACIGPPYDYASRENCDSWWQQAFFHMPRTSRFRIYPNLCSNRLVAFHSSTRQANIPLHSCCLPCPSCDLDFLFHFCSDFPVLSNSPLADSRPYNDGCFSRSQQCELPWYIYAVVHSESLQDHELLHEKLHQGQSSAESEPERKAVGTTLSFEMKHYHVLKRFGRYPSRNEALQRQSTKEEEEFLKENGAGW